MDFFRTPGAGLLEHDKAQFEDIRNAIDQSTNDYLIRPDWAANMRCVDQMNELLISQGRGAPLILRDVMLVLRRKLASKVARITSLTLSLVETLVKNCGSRFHKVVNEDPILNEMEKVLKKYGGRTNADNREVADLCLDIIQAWGEAFLPEHNTYPNIVKLYQKLRRENMPFKSRVDPERMPQLNAAPTARSQSAGPSAMSSQPHSTPSSSTSSSNAMDDAMLAAALNASRLDANRSRQATQRPSVSSSSSSRGAAASSSSSSSNAKRADVLSSLGFSTGVLTDMIEASTTREELIHNDVAAEIAAQMTFLLTSLSEIIEVELNRNPDDLVPLFKQNDDSQGILTLYNEIKVGTSTLNQAKDIIREVRSMGDSKGPSNASDSLLDIPESPKATPSSSSSSASATSDFLDIFSASPSVPLAPPPPVPGRSVPVLAPPPVSATGASRRPSNTAPAVLAPPPTTLTFQPMVTNSNQMMSTPPPIPVVPPVVPQSVPFDPFGSTSTSFSAPTAGAISQPVFDPFGSSGSIDDFLMSTPAPPPPPQVYAPASTPSAGNDLFDLFGGVSAAPAPTAPVTGLTPTTPQIKSFPLQSPVVNINNSPVNNKSVVVPKIAPAPSSSSTITPATIPKLAPPPGGSRPSLAPPPLPPTSQGTAAPPTAVQSNPFDLF